MTRPDDKPMRIVRRKRLNRFKVRTDFTSHEDLMRYLHNLHKLAEKHQRPTPRKDLA